MSDPASNHPERAISTAEAVARILACADVAVDTIARSAQRQVSEIEAGVEARAAQETVERQARLERLRHELGERAAELATAYAGITAELGEVDRALAALGKPAVPAAANDESDARVAAIKMTLRERRRIQVFADASSADADAGSELAAPPPFAGQEIEPPDEEAARLAWRLWERAA